MIKLPKRCPYCRARRVKREDYARGIKDGEFSARVTYECGCTVIWERDQADFTDMVPQGKK